MNKGIEHVLRKLIQEKDLDLCGQSCLLVSHLCWSNKLIQMQLSKREIVRRLISLADFNELINQAVPESTVEQVQEVVFFALLALINLLQKNSAC